MTTRLIFGVLQLAAVLLLAYALLFDLGPFA